MRALSFILSFCTSVREKHRFRRFIAEIGLFFVIVLIIVIHEPNIIPRS